MSQDPLITGIAPVADGTAPIDLSREGGLASLAASPTGAEVQAKLAELHRYLEGLGSLVVAFSGGVDSAFLLWAAHDALGDQAVGLTAVSPSLPMRERESASNFAREIGVKHVMRESDEIHNPKYQANPKSRCYYCKMAIFDLAEAVRDEHGFSHIAVGTNVDDLGDHRPGQAAGRQRGIVEPLLEAGFTKADIRRAGQLVGLSVWDKPEFACLSSRVPYGTTITAEKLGQIETCEDVLRDLEFRIFRVRYHDDMVRIELGVDEIHRALHADVREALVARCKAAGFKYVSLDLEGYRRGSMNE